MSGKELRKKLTDAGYGLCDLAHKMGMSTEQNLYSLLRVNDVRSGLLERLSETLGRPIGWFYGEESAKQSSAASDNGISVAGDSNIIATISDRYLGLLEEKDKQINTLLEMINNK